MHENMYVSEKEGPCKYHSCGHSSVCITLNGLPTCVCPSCSEEFQPVCRTMSLLPPTKEEVYAIARMFVCLSVSKITKKRLHGFGWNFACRQVVDMDELVNFWARSGSLSRCRNRKMWKSKICRSRSNRHLTQSRLQVTGCTAGRYCLLHVVVQGAGSFADRSTFLYDVRLLSYWASKLPNFRLLAYFPHTKPLKRQNDLEWPLSQISMSRYYSTSNNSQTVQDRAIVTMAD